MENVWVVRDDSPQHANFSAFGAGDGSTVFYVPVEETHLED